MAPPAFASSVPIFRNRHTHHSRLSHRQRNTKFTIISQTSAPPPIITGTPCFTPNIMATPMPSNHRHAYLDAVSASLHEYLTNLKSQPHPARAKLTLLPPQLNPQLDVYDRRFLLQLLWATLLVTASLNLRTRVLIQGPRQFGAVPLSIAGLRRTFDADLALSIEDWPVLLRSGELENPDDVDDEDDIVFVLSPTNAVSIPVVTSVENLVQRVGDKPVVLINPRLDDVPSHSGVMQVSGRAERINLLQSFQQIFYMRLLFKAGTSYPLRGILYCAYPGPWQIWRPFDGNAHYALILSADDNPDSEDINNAFSRDSYKRQKELLRQSKEQGTALDAFLTSPQVVVFFVIVSLLAASALVDSDKLQLFLHFAGDPVPR